MRRWEGSKTKGREGRTGNDSPFRKIMEATIVVGGQWGSEGKAKAAVHVVNQYTKLGLKTACVRCGGPNAGHTVYIGNQKVILRHVPSGIVNPDCYVFIAAGACIDLEVLQKDIACLESLGVPVNWRLKIHPTAAIVDREAKASESSHHLGELIGSTLSGTGATAAARAMRQCKLASSIPELKPYLADVTEAINTRFDNVVIEGTQGFGLSLWHGPYPTVTSKDVTAAAVASEAGIPITSVKDVLMVVRTYPIRVGGNSGPMEKEITWEEIRKRSGATMDITETTSVTKRIRRVSEFDWSIFHRACMVNGPTQIAVHGLDYISYSDRGVRSIENLSRKSVEFLIKINAEVQKVARCAYISQVFTGPHQDDLVSPYESGSISLSASHQDRLTL